MGQFQRRTIEKHYLALLERTPPTPIGRITAPIMRDPANRRRMTVMRAGLGAVNGVLCTCGDAEPSLIAAAESLAGAFSPSGILPVG